MGNTNELEKLQELALKNLVPDVQKSMYLALKNTVSLARSLNGEVSKLNAFSPARLHPNETRPIVIRDTTKREYQFTMDSDGKSWAPYGFGIQYFLNYICRTYREKHRFDHAVTQALEAQKKHLPFHKRLIDINPIIGTSILLSRTRLPKVVTNDKELNNEVDPAKWYESHLNHAECALKAISETFSHLRERCTDTITQSFLKDYQRECELLITETCAFSFLLLDEILSSRYRGGFKLLCITLGSSFTISRDDYTALEKDILRLRNAYCEYMSERLDAVFPVPVAREVYDTGVIRLPVQVSIHDIEALLSNYSEMWKQLAQGLSDGKAHAVVFGKSRILNNAEIGIQSGSTQSQDRMSFRIPEFNIRVDKDPRHKTLALDVGSASIAHALSSAEEALSSIYLDKKLPCVFRNKPNAGTTGALLENKMALIASVIMGSSHLLALRKRPTISHHSREFVAKDDYYNNFTHILASIKDGLEKSAQ